MYTAPFSTALPSIRTNRSSVPSVFSRKAYFSSFSAVSVMSYPACFQLYDTDESSFTFATYLSGKLNERIAVVSSVVVQTVASTFGKWKSTVMDDANEEM